MVKKGFRFFLGLIGLLALTAAGLLAWSHVVVDGRVNRVYSVSAGPIDFSQANLETGERVVMIRNGCVDCHGADLGGARVMDDSVFATIHGPNITSGGLASWSDAEIARAIRHGIGKDGKPLLLMPSHEYQHLSREDLVSAVAYLRSVPPVERENGPVKLGPMAKILTATGRLPTMITAEVVDHAADFHDKPDEAPTFAFGHYLVQSGCVGCHGPELRGGPIPGGPPEWPPASDISRTTVSGWTRELFLEMMQKGVGSHGEPLKPPMPVALTAQLNEVELEAIWLFLKGEE